MNISSAQNTPAVRATRALAPAATPKGGPRTTQAAPTAPAAPAPGDDVAGLQERLDLFQEGVHGRMDELAGKLGGDAAAALADARGQFDQHVQRLRDGLTSGGLDVTQVTAGAQATLGLLQGDLALATGSTTEPAGMPEPHPAEEPGDVSARLDALQGQLQGRIEEAFQDDPEGLARTSGELRESFARIRGGLESGGLDLRGAVQGLQQALDNVARSAAAGPQPVANSVDAPDALAVQASVVRGAGTPHSQDRFQAMTARLLERLQGFGASMGDESGAVAGIGQDLASALGRIHDAVFEGGGMDRDQMAQLVSETLGGLTSQLGQLFPEPARTNLYGHQAKPQQGLVPPSTLDLSV